MTAIPAVSPGFANTLEQRRRARMAVALIFAVNGVLVGSWAPRIPTLKDHLHLSAGALGLALLAPALGTVLAARTVGARTARHGTAAVTRVCGVLYCLIAWLPGVAINLGTLWFALLLWGMSMGAMDVAMNAQGVSVETYYGRPVLSGFHATWSIGSFLGALLGATGAALHVDVALQQAVIGAVLAAAVLLLARHLMPDPPALAAAQPAADAPCRRRLRLPHAPQTRLVLLGVSAIFALMTEGAVADWSAVLLREHLDVPGSRAGFAYAAFCVTMTAGRFAGDRLVHMLGRARCFAAVALIGAVGLGFGLAGNSFGTTVAGFALLGIGLSIMVPTLYSTAADTDGPSGPAIAAVAALGCVGMLVGPSLIGLVAQLTSIDSALYLLPPFTIAAGALGVVGIRLSSLARSRSRP
jgi:MFS family permease